MIPNWCYHTLKEPNMKIPKPLFMVVDKPEDDPLQHTYYIGIKWFRQIKGRLVQFGCTRTVPKLPSKSVLAFIEKLWMEDIDIYDKMQDRWDWIPLVGHYLSKRATDDLFRIPPLARDDDNNY